jgi:hypothetical protein
MVEVTGLQALWAGATPTARGDAKSAVVNSIMKINLGESL